MYSRVTEILLIVVIFQLLFISLFLFTHSKSRRTSNLILGAFFLSVSLNLLDSLLVLERIYDYNTLLVAWGSCLPLLFGPLLYLYTQSVLYKDFRFSQSRWLHLLPFIVFFLVTEGSYISLSERTRVSIIRHVIKREIPPYIFWVSSVIFLQFFIYIGASLRLIKKYKKFAGDQFSDQERNNVAWLNSTILFFAVCMILSVLNNYAELTPLGKYYFLFLTIVFLGVFLFISQVLMKALKRPDIFGVIEESTQQSVPGKYQGSNLKDEDKKRISQQLIEFMSKDKPWQEPELTLEDLSTKLSVRPKILSQVINETLNQNFFDFVNRYRIEEAKRLLTNPPDKKITVLEVLYEVGFNSKSSFNTLFKKHTGLTPSEFKKKNLS